MAQLNVEVSGELVHAVKMAATYNKVPMSKYVREILIAAVTADPEVTRLLTEDMRKRLDAANDSEKVTA